MQSVAVSLFLNQFFLLFVQRKATTRVRRFVHSCAFNAWLCSWERSLPWWLSRNWTTQRNPGFRLGEIQTIGEIWELEWLNILNYFSTLFTSNWFAFLWCFARKFILFSQGICGWTAQLTQLALGKSKHLCNFTHSVLARKSFACRRPVDSQVVRPLRKVLIRFFNPRLQGSRKPMIGWARGIGVMSRQIKQRRIAGYCSEAMQV